MNLLLAHYLKTSQKNLKVGKNYKLLKQQKIYTGFLLSNFINNF